jgi:hypothetical protein
MAASVYSCSNKIVARFATGAVTHTITYVLDWKWESHAMRKEKHKHTHTHPHTHTHTHTQRHTRMHTHTRTRTHTQTHTHTHTRSRTKPTCNLKRTDAHTTQKHKHTANASKTKTVLPQRVCCAQPSAMLGQHAQAPEQAQSDTAPTKNPCDKQVSSWRHISCHTDKNRYYT